MAKDLGGIYRAPAPLSFGQQPMFKHPFGVTTIKIMPVAENESSQAILPYTDPQFNPLKKCLHLSSGDITPAPINSKYPKDLQEQLYVIYKDYRGDDNPQERAGKAYAQLLLTDQGQKILEHIGFQRLPNSERSK